jgi:hypothetical protein
MPLRRSHLITQKQLNCLSGGKKDHGSKHGNPLRLGTLFSITGGSSLALARNQIQHICIKEECNHPLTETRDEEFIVYQIERTYDALPKDIELLRKRRRIIHLFQSFGNPPTKTARANVEGGMGVFYLGHWKLSKIETVADDDGKEKRMTYVGINRCARLTFRFDRYDARTAAIIGSCYNKSCAQIAELTFDTNELFKNESANSEEEATPPEPSALDIPSPRNLIPKHEPHPVSPPQMAAGQLQARVEDSETDGQSAKLSLRDTRVLDSINPSTSLVKRTEGSQAFLSSIVLMIPTANPSMMTQIMS